MSESDSAKINIADNQMELEDIDFRSADDEMFSVSKMFFVAQKKQR